ncbi:MAG: formate dehydrogenase accessory sulfurtransferase FdhD [Bowdeniella nasicola]|nr:formate dehydrogenase accessory sulfurtransferase FdhD [Bowdeniella nasicola]
MGRFTDRFRVTRVRASSAEGARPAWDVDTRADVVAVEEPLEIRVGGTTLTTTMRTPGADIELVHGFLLAESIIRGADDIATARYCAGATGPDGRNTYNVIEVELAPGVAPVRPEQQRLVTTTSACGVCGSASIDTLLANRTCAAPGATIPPDVLLAAPGLLRSEQEGFRRTGGMHAAGLVRTDGSVLVVREDIGRHNAADKVIGWGLMNGVLPAGDIILAMSSRASFELVHKAVLAGVGALAAVSAPSSLAIETAREAGLVLAAFVSGSRMNLYAHADRVLPGDPRL